MKHRWLKGFFWTFFLVLYPLTSFAESAIKQIVIVKSSDNAYFNQTITTLVKHIDSQLKVTTIDAEQIHQQPADATVLFVTLGQRAAVAAAKHRRQAGLVNSYITFEQRRTLEAVEGDTSILLDQPLERYLAFSKLLLDIDSLGIVERQPLNINSQVETSLAQLELQLHEYRVDAENKLLPVLRKLLQQEDALLMLPRQLIYNRDSLKGVLLTGYRSRKPVISYSPAHVESGALASIYSSPIDIGRHLALTVRRKLNGDTPSIYEFARFYTITTNSRVAHALDIELPDEEELRLKLDGIQR